MAAPQPAIITATPVVFPAASPSGQALSPTVRLRNDNDSGVNVDRIVISPVDPSGDITVLTGASAGLSLRLGNEPITNGYVPITSVAWALNADSEANRAIAITLSKPMYIAPGDYLDVSIRNDFQAATNVQFNLAAIGKQCAPSAASPWLPYLTAFQSQIYDGTSAAVISESSNPTDLGNPFTDEITVTHFIGRIYSSALAAGGFGGLPPSQSWSAMQIRLADHRDALLIPRFTPLTAVIDNDTYAWQVNTPLAGRGYYKLDLGGVATWGAPSPGFNFARLAFGMQGYRRVA